MRFKQQRQTSMPAVDLIPMLNVMMAVLAFFVMISTTLSTQEGVEISLPDDTPSNLSEKPPEPLVIELNAQQQLVLHEQVLSESQVREQVQAYLANTPQGSVLLNAEATLAYAEVVQRLGMLRDLGGDRVSLTIPP